jgi:hypothetical protein
MALAARFRKPELGDGGLVQKVTHQVNANIDAAIAIRSAYWRPTYLVTDCFSLLVLLQWRHRTGPFQFDPFSLKTRSDNLQFSRRFTDGESRFIFSIPESINDLFFHESPRWDLS